MIILIVLSLVHVISVAILVVSSKRPLSLIQYFHVYAVRVITNDGNHSTSFGALSFKDAFFVIGGRVLVQGLNRWVLIIDVRACFVNVLVEIGAEKRGQVL